MAGIFQRATTAHSSGRPTCLRRSGGCSSSKGAQASQTRAVVVRLGAARKRAQDREPPHVRLAGRGDSLVELLGGDAPRRPELQVVGILTPGLGAPPGHHCFVAQAQLLFADLLAGGDLTPCRPVDQFVDLVVIFLGDMLPVTFCPLLFVVLCRFLALLFVVLTGLAASAASACRAARARAPTCTSRPSTSTFRFCTSRRTT